MHAVGAVLVIVAGAVLVVFRYPIARWQRSTFERWQRRGFPPWEFAPPTLRTNALCVAALGLGCVAIGLLALFGRIR